MRRSAQWLSLLVLLTLLLAACGGDAALSDQAYFEALEDVAAAAEAQDAALDAAFPFDEPPEPETISAFLEAFQATFIDARAGVIALAVPRDLAPAHDASVAAQDAVIEAFEEARAKVETVAALQTFFEEADPLFDAFALACKRLESHAEDRDIAVELFCPER